MAVSVELDSGNLFVYGDSANDKVVIEERGEGNLEKWVYVNGKLFGGSPITATNGGLFVDLGGGKDSLTIRSGAEGYVNAELYYEILLGDGKDTFLWDTGNVTNSWLNIGVIDLGAGNDKATIKLGDVFVSNIGLDDCDSYIYLGGGNDSFALSWSSITNSTVSLNNDGDPGIVLGEGSDTAKVTRGDIANSYVAVSIDTSDGGGCTDAGFKNKVTISGKGTVSQGAYVMYDVWGGAGVDIVHYDDERIIGQGTRVEFDADLGDGDDVLTMVLDGLRKWETGIGNEAGDFSMFTFEAYLGSGNDVFKQTFAANAWRLQNGTLLGGYVDGADGNDTITVKTSGSRVLNLDGVFNLQIVGGDGSDKITVTLPRVLRIGYGVFNLHVYGDYYGKSCFTSEFGYDDNISVLVNFVSSSANAPGLGVDEGYGAFITVCGGDGFDKVKAVMNNFSIFLSVTIALDVGVSGDVFTTFFTGLYEIEALVGCGGGV